MDYAQAARWGRRPVTRAHVGQVPAT
jgi:hypothetical protein